MSGLLTLKKIKLGDNADTSKNFIISVPAVADGTLTIERENGTDVLTIDASGNIRAGAACNLAGNGPAFSAYQSVTQSIANLSLVKVQLNGEQFDTHNCFDTTTYRFTPNVAGYYQINGVVGLALASSGCVAFIYKNGANVKYGSGGVGSSNLNASSEVSSLIYMNGTTDYLELYVYQPSGGAVNTNAAPNQVMFSGFLARAA